MKYRVLVHLGISLVVSFFIMRWEFNRSAAPQVITYDNPPYEFMIVGATPENKHLLLTIYELSHGIQFPDERKTEELKNNRAIFWPNEHVIWLDETDRYKYHIDHNDLKSIEQKLNGELSLNRKSSVRQVLIEIIQDKRNQGKQQIQLSIFRDGMIQFCYEVQDNKFTPIYYREWNRSTGFGAAVMGFLSFIGSMVILHLCYVLWCKIKKQTATGVQT
jgi:hypothetical protein